MIKILPSRPTIIGIASIGLPGPDGVDAKGDMMKFAENVAVNRGLPVTLFASVAEAKA